MNKIVILKNANALVLGALLVALCTGQEAVAQSFTGTYNWSTNGNTNSFAYNGTPIANLTVGNFTKNGVTSSSSSGDFRASNWALDTQPAGGLTGSVDLAKYFEFSLTADAGYVIDMSSVTFGLGRSSSGPRTFQWRSSVDSYSSIISTYSTLPAGVTNSGGVLTIGDISSGYPTGIVLDLSGASFQNLTSLTLRFYGYNAELTSGTGGFEGDLSFAGAMENTNPVGAVYWAPAVGGGGTGTWSTVDTNWATAAGVQGSATQGTGTLIFGDAAGTATVSGTVTVSNGITFQTTGYTVTGGTAVELAGGSTAVNAITTDTGVTATLASPLTGSNGLTKSGSGTLVLSAANALSGQISLLSGTLDLAAPGALTNASSFTIAGAMVLSGVAGDRLNDNATVNISAGGSFDLAGLSETIGALQLTAGTVQTGVGTLTLGGNVTINSGATATVTGNIDLGGATRTITFANGGSTTDADFDNAVISNGGLVLVGGADAARLDLASASTFAGGTTLSSGTLVFAGSSTGSPGAVTSGPVGTGTLTINGGLVSALGAARTIHNALSIGGNFGTGSLSTLLVLAGDANFGGAVRTVTVNNNPLELAGALGNGGMTKVGTGTMTFSGTTANTFSGVTTVSAGTLRLNKTADVTAIAGDLTVNSGAFLLLSSSGNVSDAAEITLSGGTITRGAGVSEVFGALTLGAAGGTLDFGTGAIGTLSFGSYTPSALLTVNNFLPGNKLQFTSSLTEEQLNNPSLFSFSNGFSTGTEGSYFTITAIPEPSTYFAVAGLLVLMAWPSRKRIVRDAKKILGMTPPMRDRLARRAS